MINKIILFVISNLLMMFFSCSNLDKTRQSSNGDALKSPKLPTFVGDITIMNMDNLKTGYSAQTYTLVSGDTFLMLSITNDSLKDQIRRYIYYHCENDVDSMWAVEGDRIGDSLIVRSLKLVEWDSTKWNSPWR